MRKFNTLIVILLIVSLIAACSSSGSSTNSNSSSNSGQQNSSTQTNKETPTGSEAAKDEDAADEGAVLNMNGQTITILQHLPAPAEGTEIGDLQVARIKEVEEKFNVNIEFNIVPWGENVNMVTNAGLSGEPIADIVLFDLRHAIPLINQGLLQPVDDYFDFDDPKWPKGMKEYGSFKGKAYGFIDNITHGGGIYFNRTLFEREGLPDPHQLVAEGKWNWDTFLDIAKRATRDTDGDGAIDQWGLTNHAGILARLLTYSNGGKLIDNIDGKFVFTHDDPNMLEAYHFLDALFNEHKVIAPNLQMNFNDYNDSQKMFASGKAAMVSGETWEGEGRSEMNDEQGFVIFPKGPKADDYIIGIENYYAYYMPANAKNPREAAIIWEEMILWDRSEDIRREFAEKQNVSDERDIEQLLKVSEHLVPLYLPIEGLHDWVAWGLSNRGGTVESEIEQVRQQAQAYLDERLNN